MSIITGHAPVVITTGACPEVYFNLSVARNAITNLMRHHLSKIIVVPLLIVAFSPLLVGAADVVKINNPLKVESFQALIEVVISAIFNIALLIAPLLIIISGFYWLTAADDPKKVETAKNIIKYTVIGLIIIIASKGIINLFKSVFGIPQ